MENELLPEHALEYMLGGNAILILVSENTDKCFRYRIKQKSPDLYYVSIYPSGEYIGFIRRDFSGDLTYAPKGDTAEDIQAFRWTFVRLLQKKIPKELHLLHTGICSVCSRPLTDAESLELGIGPVCRKKLGL